MLNINNAADELNQNLLLKTTIQTLLCAAAYAGGAVIIGVPAITGALVGSTIALTQACLLSTKKVHPFATYILSFAAGFAVAKGLSSLSAYTFSKLALATFGLGMATVAAVGVFSLVVILGIKLKQTYFPAAL